ncbi:Predicted DNA binding protein, CopG/RHH family [Desulfonatronum thiosulfatophilum]|uniref:Predicted DNA binding protein, CopG/RHH family n=1 Tax=Desulfonatronum thiosulfatophilum TaxID=617002 RepID=A0A1G6AMI6_9BACT|nr:antitoxin [Desulfonatronum thiosulfatophilum]SDB09373.1 Predicted DNA binding protein, CopG/RHH family [Desulfonatronum thiosulfatophilum]
MSRFDNKTYEPLDQEEKDLMESLEREGWQSVPDSEKQVNAARLAARNTLRKDKRINLRLSQKDYHRIQIRAVEEGIPYQTFISSLVHKYLDGKLIQKQ